MRRPYQPSRDPRVFDIAGIIDDYGVPIADWFLVASVGAPRVFFRDRQGFAVPLIVESDAIVAQLASYLVGEGCGTHDSVRGAIFGLQERDRSARHPERLSQLRSRSRSDGRRRARAS